MALSFIQLTDIHYLAHRTISGNKFRDLQSELFLDVKENAVKQLGKIEAILICGDIAFSGKEAEYKEAKKYLNDLCAAAGIGKENVLCVPGNHDIDRDVCKNDVILEAIQNKIDSQKGAVEIDEVITKSNDGPDPDKLYSHLKAYNEFAKQYCCDLGGTRPFWNVDYELEDGYILRIHGFNSVITCNHLDKEGKKVAIGISQLPAREQKVINMTICHHPPDCWNDPDKIISNMINIKAPLQLYGHKHIQVRKMCEGTIRIGCGATEPPGNESDWAAYYNWITISLIEKAGNFVLTFDITPRVYTREETEFEMSNEGGDTHFEIVMGTIDKIEHEAIGVKEKKVQDIKAFALKNEVISDKKLLYHFINLSYLDQAEILRMHGYIPAGQDIQDHGDVIRENLENIDKRGQRSSLWDDIKKKENGN